MGKGSQTAGSQEKRVTMFAGKGGVGKTTCAATTALHQALLKEETLVISTDPTPSLSHIFEIGNKQKPARVRENLELAELGLDEVKQMWDRKFGQEVYEIFSSFVSVDYEEFVDFVSSILPGLRDEFMVDYIRELSQKNKYKRIVWDTAPLGQTLGLLEMPTMLRKHLKPAPRIYSKLVKLGTTSKRSVLDILKGWEKLSAKDMDFLKNEVQFTIVTIPEALAVEQLDYIFDEFGRYGFRFDQMIINNVIKERDSPFLQAKAEEQNGYIELLRKRYNDMKIVELPLFPHEIKGMARLEIIEKWLFE